MNKITIIQFAFWLLLVTPVFVNAQFEQGLEMEEQVEDETEAPKKEIKPLIKLWYLEGQGAFIDSTKLDTTLNYFHLYNPIYHKNDVSVAYLGNYGTPYQNNNFFEREKTFDFFFLQNREAYLLSPEKVQYYNTRTPYTMLDFSQSEHRTRKNETRFNVLHTQNINPFFNVTLRYDQARSEGQYENQAAKNSFVNVNSNYNRNNLRIHGGVISNTIRNYENGGLTNINDILRNDDTEFLDVNLNNTQSVFGNFYAYATGEYRIGKGGIKIKSSGDSIRNGEEVDLEVDELEIEPFRPILGIIYSFEYQNNKREFSDEEETSNDYFEFDYYGDNYYKDSIRFRKISNLLQLKQYENPESKTSFGKRAFLGQELVKATSPGPLLDTANWRIKRYSNIYAGAGIFRETGKFWTWNFDGKIYLLGRNAGQTELSGIISKPFSLLGDSAAAISIDGKLQNLVPDYFQEEFYAQHIR
ncbi:MAG TPA: putative porin, partial [Prolixibacteraceae bacterium]|nr:putative porin [Prolixibacteraceae bacterium]